jgi:hypothetical protein
MLDPAEKPTLGVFSRVVWADWGSRVSGVASVPFTIAALMANPMYGKSIWIALAVLCVLLTAYQVWARERRHVVELHGRPEVLLATLQIGAQHGVEYLLRFNNASDNVATNVTLNSVQVEEASGNVITVEFSPLSHLSRSPAPENMHYVIRGTGGISRRNLIEALGLDKRADLAKTPHIDYKILVGFSNYGGTDRWETQYTLECDLISKSIFCRPGSCTKVT